MSIQERRKERRKNRIINRRKNYKQTLVQLKTKPERVITPADVLFVLNTSVDTSWITNRGKTPIDKLNAHGISAQYTQDKDDIPYYLNTGTKVVISRAFAIPQTFLEVIVEEYPDTNFVSCCHSSQSYLMLSNGKSLKRQNTDLQLVQKHENFYYATVDERNYLGRLHSRCIYFPNAIDTSRYHLNRRMPEETTISLFGRPDVIKNFPQQIIALAELKKKVNYKLLAGFKGSDQTLLDTLKVWGIENVENEWCAWDSFIKKLSQVSLGLQCSFSESFNYVALEHLLCGIPVVGSPAIRYLPPQFQANPEDPDDITKVITKVLNSTSSPEELRALGLEVAKQCNQVFVETVKSLLQR